ncbi:MAG: hypothetical protein HY318_13460 [Armatimonadetes bacterium]|nr:hypothetical protein [Armatimonadota bacterium]
MRYLVCGILLSLYMKAIGGSLLSAAEVNEKTPLPTGRISGVVKHAPPGTRVLLRKRGYDVTANVPCNDKTGAYVIGGLQGGTYDLMFLSPDGRAWCGIDPAKAGSLGKSTSREIASLIRRYEDWRNGLRGVEEILSTSFVGPDGRKHETIVKQDTEARNANALRRQEALNQPAEETYRWTVVAQNARVREDGAFVVVVKETLTRKVMDRKAKTVCSNEWIGFVVCKERFGLRIAGVLPLVDRMQMVNGIKLVPSAKLAGIPLKEGETSVGHDIDLPLPSVR